MQPWNPRINKRGTTIIMLFSANGTTKAKNSYLELVQLLLQNDRFNRYKVNYSSSGLSLVLSMSVVVIPVRMAIKPATIIINKFAPEPMANPNIVLIFQSDKIKVKRMRLN